MNDDDLMRRAWRSMPPCACEDICQRAYEQMNSKERRKTALMMLARRYRRFMTVEVIMMVYSVILFFNPAIMDLNPAWVRYAIPVIFFFLFIISFLLDWRLMTLVESIDVLRMPTSEVIARSLGCRRLHIRSIIVMFPMAIAVVLLLGWGMRDNVYMVAGIACGFVVGLCIGLLQLSRFLSDYRVLTAGNLPDNRGSLSAGREEERDGE